MLELVWEDGIEEAHESKKEKYLELVEESRNQGWKVCCKALEADCSLYVEPSVSLALEGCRREEPP